MRGHGWSGVNAYRHPPASASRPLSGPPGHLTPWPLLPLHPPWPSHPLAGRFCPKRRVLRHSERASFGLTHHGKEHTFTIIGDTKVDEFVPLLHLRLSKIALARRLFLMVLHGPLPFQQIRTALCTTTIGVGDFRTDSRERWFATDQEAHLSGLYSSLQAQPVSHVTSPVSAAGYAPF